MRGASGSRRLVSLVAVGALALALGGVAIGPAVADTAPADPALPVTVTTDALPTVQINGVVWTQVIVGNTVFVGGNFTSARPAGSPAGTNEVPRSNFLAYNLTTGALITSFAPSFNAQVKDLAVSPDKTTLYVAGQFTQVDGNNRYRVAAFTIATGALSTTFRPTINSTVNTIAASATGVYVGGPFTSVNGAARQKVAGLAVSNAATLPMSVSVPDGSLLALVVAPDGGSVVIGGSFTTVNGSSSPGYGLARVDTATGASLPLPVNTQIRNGGADSAILSLETDDTHFYGSGYHFGGGGNVEGTFSSDWATGSLTWVEDCHGDTYSAFPAGGAVYQASHKHYCGNSGGFPQTTPWTFYHATAVSKVVGGVNTPDIYGYPDHAGQPSPYLLTWFPDLNAGTFTGKTQGPWTVSGNDDYVLMGGEFTQVNGIGQQGLVRFAVSSIAPNTDGPRLTGGNFPLSATSFAAGTARVNWSANWDRDNQTLTYALYRGTQAAPPIYTQTMTTPFWDPKRMGFNDTGLTPGSTQRYRVVATDPFGNIAQSNWVTVTVSASGSLSPYAAAVLGDSPADFWRLGESTGPTVYDWAGWSDAIASTGVSRGVTGAIGGDTDAAVHVDGTPAGLVATQSPQAGPQVFTIEAWFRTTTTTGGKIVGFGNANTGNSSNYDRHVYMEPSGQITFGVYPGDVRTVTSGTTYNDGAWHQVVASLGSAGMSLSIDGKRVAQRGDVTSAQGYDGYWRIGGDSPWSGDAYFAGDIDDVAIYDTVLSRHQVDAHYVASGRPSAFTPRPADAYGAAVYDLDPDVYWRLGEATGPAAADSSQTGANPGVYSGNVTPGAVGVLSGVTNSAADFGGSSGLVASTTSFVNPTVYSEELWFRTTTTDGGKLIGFGNSPSGTSSGYDRHIYMENDGRLTFGTWTGQPNTATTPASYNDGLWHHMVATQSSDGMNLYVDGLLRASNPQTAAQDYTGFWRVGGDTTWGPQPWFAGTIDEVAVYSTALTPAQVHQHYDLGAVVANLPPVAAFTTTVTDLGVAVNGSASSDSDGTVASYAWQFGDGAVGTGATASHTYATAGSYTITLTVTDDDGATASVTHGVVVTAPNVAPTAAFSVATAELVASVDGSGSADSDGTVASYAWQFGDGATASGPTASHAYAAAGTFTITLVVTDNSGATAQTTHDVSVAPTPVNQLPVATFTSTVTDLSVAFDGSASADSDGTVVGWAWSFGDGATATGPTATHTYATAGTKSVTLVVTDNLGATGSSTSSVVVTEPVNTPPVAAFTSSVTDLSVALDASTSSDAEGPIASYAWAFGDGGTGTGATATHTYAAAGTYSVTVTVTDGSGATGAVTHPVVVTAPPVSTALARDSFTRALLGSWGAATTGGPWALTGSAGAFTVNGQAGVQNLLAGATLGAALTTVSATSTEVQVIVSADKVPTGSGAYVRVEGRRISPTDAYAARLRLQADGSVQLHVTRGNGTPVSGGVVTGLTFAAGDRLQVRLQVDGTAPTTVRAKVWKVGTPEPGAWRATMTDSTASLQVAGSVALGSYLFGSVTNAPVAVSFDDLWAGAVGTTPGGVTNIAPLVVFTSSTANLTASFDASGSSDPDGSIAGFGWVFGDGATGTGATASRAYAAAGTYTATLTVTDNLGATASVSHLVTVTTGTPGPGIARDGFARIAANGWGTAEIGGTWSTSGAIGSATVDGSAGLLTIARSTTVSATLSSVSATSTDTVVAVTPDKVPTGSGAFVYVAGRIVSATDFYGARVRLRADGVVEVHATRANGTPVSGGVVSGLTYAAGDTLMVRVQVDGISPTTVRVKVWKAGTAEPTTWRGLFTDSSATLQVPGSVGVSAYLFGTATNSPLTVRFDNLDVNPVL